MHHSTFRRRMMAPQRRPHFVVFVLETTWLGTRIERFIIRSVAKEQPSYIRIARCVWASHYCGQGESFQKVILRKGSLQLWYHDHHGWATSMHTSIHSVSQQLRKHYKIRKVLSLYNFKAWERNVKQQTKVSICIYRVPQSSWLHVATGCLLERSGSSESSLSSCNQIKMLSHSTAHFWCTSTHTSHLH
jgi:hypothetical protein